MVVIIPIIREDYQDKYVVLIRKTHPEWQKGLLNCPGGHIEDDKMPVEAAAREFTEETDIILGAHTIEPVGRTHYYDDDGGGRRIVFFYTVRLDASCKNTVEKRAAIMQQKVMSPGNDEIPVVMRIEEALAHKDLVSNLRMIIPKAMLVLDEWVDGD